MLPPRLLFPLSAVLLLLVLAPPAAQAQAVPDLQVAVPTATFFPSAGTIALDTNVDNIGQSGTTNVLLPVTYYRSQAATLSADRSNGTEITPVPGDSIISINGAINVADAPVSITATLRAALTGNYYYFVCVDAGANNGVSETALDNNCGRTADLVSTTAAAPDLEIGTPTVTTSTTPLELNANITLTTRVTNIGQLRTTGGNPAVVYYRSEDADLIRPAAPGDAATPNSDVEVTPTGPSATIPNLAPQGFSNLDATLSADTAGEFYYFVCVAADANVINIEEAVPETAKDNNCAGTAAPVRTTQSDLFVTAAPAPGTGTTTKASVTDRVFVAPRSPFQITAIVGNRGTAATASNPANGALATLTLYRSDSAPLVTNTATATPDGTPVDVNAIAANDGTSDGLSGPISFNRIANR